MAKEPIDIVPEMLRKMRAEFAKEFGSLKEDMRQIKKNQDMHTLRFDFLEERVEMLREGALTAIGFAANTNVQQKKLEKQLQDIAKRVQKLEKSR